jgi:DNA-binding response OmpR family regulator
MRILLVEDDEEKRDEIVELLEGNYEPDITIQMSFRTGKKAIRDDSFDLILLDMDIPTFDITTTESGGRKQAFGGRLLMSEMLRRNIETKVLVITQFDYFENTTDGLNLTQLDQQLKDEYTNIYMGCIQMKGGSEDWKEKLLTKIND